MPRTMDGSLEPRQQRFVEEYLVDLNATQAALRAGYSPHTAYDAGWQNLRKTEIQQAISIAYRERSQRTGITADRVLLEIGRIAFHNPKKLYDTHGQLLPVSAWDDDTAACIAGLEVAEIWEVHEGERVVVGQLKKLKFWPKDKALDQLGRHLTLFGKQDEHTRSISELLKAVLLELQHGPRPQVALEAEWTPMPPGQLPAPPLPDETKPSGPEW